jgi:hypothetical protein
MTRRSSHADHIPGTSTKAGGIVLNHHQTRIEPC